MTSLVDFQKSIFEQIESFKSQGDERLVVRFFSGGLHFAMDSEIVVSVSQLPSKLPAIPAAPAYIRGLVQQDGHVLTVFDLGHLVSGHVTPVSRTNRVLMLHPSLALATGLLVEKTFGLVSLPTLMPEPVSPPLPASVEKWTNSRWRHADSADIVWHWIQPNSLLTDAAFAARRP